MASRVSYIRIGGYTLFEGSEVRVKNNKMYTRVNGTASNTINMLTQCVMQVTALYEGADAYNPIQLKWKSGPSGSYNGGGFIKTSQVVSGSGTPNNFIINYNSNGGSGSMSQSTFTYGQSNKLSTCTFKKTGHSFAGWHAYRDCDNKWRGYNSAGTDGWYSQDQIVSYYVYGNGSTMKTTAPHGTVHLYAQWKPNTYTITYKANGGSGADVTQQVTYGQNFTTKSSNTFSRIGYTFQNWLVNNNPSDSCGANTTHVYQWTNNISIYASWKINTYSNQVNAYINGITGGGSHGNGKSQKILGKRVNTTYNSSITLNESVFGQIPNGYTPSPPFNDISGKPTFTWGQTLKQPAAECNFHEWFNPVSYTITYNLNGGTNNPSNPSTYTVIYPVTFLNPTKTGHTFYGWRNDSNGVILTGLNINCDNSKVIMGNNWSGNYDIIINELNNRTAANISVTAEWTANIYTLTINPNGGTWNGSSSQQSFNQAYGTTKTISTNPTKTGYTFTGWSLSGKGSINGQTFTFSDGNAVLTAQWKISQCTITYMPNGGTGTNQTQTVEYGLGCYIRGAIFSRTGYTLDSWNTSPSGNGVRYNLDAWQSSITKDITLYAIWQINTWTVSYDANGGINAPSSQTKYYNESLTLSYYAPTKTGYTFLYWNTSIYGSGTTYYPGDSYTLNSNVTLYAQWIVNTYTVKFDANGGNCSISSKNVNYNNSIGTLPVAKRTGYIFNGWYTSSSSGLKIDESYLITDNITLYAHWTVKTSSNTFWRNFDRYDNTYMTKNYTYDSYGQYFPDYWTRTGYTFLGWNNDRTANEAIFSPNESVSNAWIDSSYPSADLFAIWNINQYTLTINPNGGTWDGYYGEESFTQNYNSTMYIQDPIRTGYTFKGWLLSGYGYLSDRTFTFGEGNTTLTAQWEIIKYSVKFDANSGLINGTQSSLIKKINHGDSLGILPIAEKEFYKFIGWFTSPTGGIQINSNTVVTKNITYYAHYESRFYVYTGGKWVKGNLYNCSGNTWKPTTLAIRIENQWK